MPIFYLIFQSIFIMSWKHIVNGPIKRLQICINMSNLGNPGFATLSDRIHYSGLMLNYTIIRIYFRSDKNDPIANLNIVLRQWHTWI